MRLTLLSNSASPDQPYLSHALAAIKEISFNDPIAFIPFALHDRSNYTEKIRTALHTLGNEILEVPHDRLKALDVIGKCKTVFVGGGNTFRLLKTLHDLELVEPISNLVISGEISYLGSSAGTNVACPEIRTTNDMPIVVPNSFRALNLVPFQINPHYMDADPKSRHMGETREQRISEFLEENETLVIGIREGAWLELKDDQLRLNGENGGVLFRRGHQSEEIETGSDLNWLLGLSPNFDS